MLTGSSRVAQRVLVASFCFFVVSWFLALVLDAGLQDWSEQAVSFLLSGLLHSFWLLPVIFVVTELHREFPIFQRDVVGDLTTSERAGRHVWIYGGFLLTFVAWFLGLFHQIDGGRVLDGWIVGLLILGGVSNLIVGFFVRDRARQTVVVSGVLGLLLAGAIVAFIFLAMRSLSESTKRYAEEEKALRRANGSHVHVDAR